MCSVGCSGCIVSARSVLISSGNIESAFGREATQHGVLPLIGDWTKKRATDQWSTVAITCPWPSHKIASALSLSLPFQVKLWGQSRCLQELRESVAITHSTNRSISVRSLIIVTVLYAQCTIVICKEFQENGGNIHSVAIYHGTGNCQLGSRRSAPSLACQPAHATL